jgi:hypothetical protein
MDCGLAEVGKNFRRAKTRGMIGKHQMVKASGPLNSTVEITGVNEDYRLPL